MSCQVVQVRLAQGSRVRKGFQRFRDSPMERGAFACQQALVDGLTYEGMPKSKLLSRLFDDQVGRDQLLHEGEQMGFITTQHLLQNGKVEASSCHGCQR